MRDREFKADFVSLTGSFNRIIDQLKNLSLFSEDHFLKIGEKLQEYYSTSKEIFQKALDVTELLSSSDYQEGINNLKSVLDTVYNYLNQTEQKFLTSSDKLSQIKKNFSDICDEVAGFKKLVKHLEVQAIAVKIESARLGNDDKGFGNLSLNINSLANLISNQFQGFREKSKSLNNVIEYAHKHINDLKINQQEYSASILHNTKFSLNELIEKYEKSSDKAGIIYSGIENINKEMSSLVKALQFHDITRQQIEHVISVLKELVNKIELVKEDEESVSELNIYTLKAASLQSAQLSNSKSQIQTALSEITENLEKVLNDISGISLEISDLIEDTGSDCSTFITQVSSGLNNVLEMLIKNAETGNELSRAIGNVVRTIDELSEFINEISNIGSEIELISLNANVKAAHTGKEGAALGVLAETIQRLSNDAKKQTDSVIHKLVSVKDITTDLFNSNDKNSLKDDEKNLRSVSEKIERINSFLNSLVGKSSGDLRIIRKDVLDLEKEISTTIKSNRQYNEYNNLLTDSVDQLNQIVTGLREFVDETSSDELELNEFNKKYTMQVQRDVHHSVINKSIDEIENDNEDQVNDQNEFGDNVELF